MSYRSIKKGILLENLEKYRDTPSNTLARILYRDYPEFFKDKEQARTSIRMYRGTQGGTKRMQVKLTKFYKDEPVAGKL